MTEYDVTLTHYGEIHYRPATHHETLSYDTSP